MKKELSVFKRMNSPHYPSFAAVIVHIFGDGTSQEATYFHLIAGLSIRISKIRVQQVGEILL